MIAKRMTQALVSAGLIATLITGAYPYTKSPMADQKVAEGIGWGGHRVSLGPIENPPDVQASGGLQVPDPDNASVTVAPSTLTLVGTWLVSVKPTASPNFQALHTYGVDGTMTETSSIFASLAEGPAHGVWSGKKSDFAGTFDLFVFDDTHQVAGVVKVHTTIHLSDADHLSGVYVADFIDLTGAVSANVDNGPFTASRVKVEPIQ